MQVGSVVRHGRGWRGYWRENGKRRATATYPRKGEARAALNRELDRLALGPAYRAPITFAELVERFTKQHDVQPQTLHTIEKRLKRPLAAWGAAEASDLTGEAVSRLLLSEPWQPAYRASILATIRLVYNWGVAARLVDANPARGVKQPRPDRSEKIVPFEDWAEVERVSEECGRWGSLVVFAVDCGARPGELVRLEHRHVDGDRVYLPGTKTAGARRVVHLTERGVEAYRSVPRSISTPLVFFGARAEGRSAGKTGGGTPGTPLSTWPGSQSGRPTRCGTRSRCGRSELASRSKTSAARWATATCRSRSRPMVSGPTRWGLVPRV